MNRPAGDSRLRGRRIGFGVGCAGFLLLLVGVQLVELSMTLAVVFGMALILWGLGSIVFGVQILYRTRARRARR